MKIKLFLVLIALSFFSFFPFPAVAEDTFAAKRQAMIERDIRGRGVKDRKVLEVMGKIPRHLFVDEHLQNEKDNYINHDLDDVDSLRNASDSGDA